MSFRNNNNKQSNKPFCKVCFDAGKAEKEYTSHYVKTEPGPNGKVVCPTLLSLTCTYCSGSGHTASYCKVLEQNKKAEAKALRRVKFAEKLITEKSSEKKKKQANLFDELNENDSDEEPDNEATVETGKQEIKVKEDFPALCSIRGKRTEALRESYAAKVAKAKETDEKSIQIYLPIPVLRREQTSGLPIPVLTRQKEDHSILTAKQEKEVVMPLSDDYDEIPYTYTPTLKASEMDWAALDSDSDLDDSDDDYYPEIYTRP